MKEKIAIATTSGKSYFLLVNELKRKNVRFLSLIPSDSIPLDVKVVITTEEEKHLVNHERVLVYDSSQESRIVIDEALRIVQGKEYFDKVIIGIDPGEVFGFVAQADETVIEKQNCFSIDQVLRGIYRVLDVSSSASLVCVKIGDGIPEFKDKLLKVFDEKLPSYVRLEIVSEAGTNRHFTGTKHRRGLRDIVSAMRIARRAGYNFPRRKKPVPAVNPEKS